MITTKLSTKGQIVIPKEVLRARGWPPGTEFAVVETASGIAIEPVGRPKRRTLENLPTIAGYAGPRISDDDIDDGLAAGLGREWTRKTA